MKKTFDDALREAFEAGVEHALDFNRTDLSSRPDAPGFEEWRKDFGGVSE